MASAYDIAAEEAERVWSAITIDGETTDTALRDAFLRAVRRTIIGCLWSASPQDSDAPARNAFHNDGMWHSCDEIRKWAEANSIDTPVNPKEWFQP